MATLRNDKPFETAGLTHLTGNWTGMWLEGTDPVLGDFVLSLPGADGTFELVAIQTGNELPATGQASFGYVMWTANFGMMQPNVAGLQSNSIPHWPMYDTAWTLTGPPQDLYPETSTIPVSRIESMTVNVRRDSDGDGISDHIDNCPFTHNILQEDDDIDGVGNACDCRPNDSSVQSTPPDATLFFLDVNTLAISADGPYGSDFDVFDVVQSNVPFDFLSGTCIATNFPFFATGVPIDSGPAIISYYLARYQNVCGDGPDHAGTGGVIVQIRECD